MKEKKGDTIMWEEYEDVFEPTMADEIYTKAINEFKDLLSEDVKAIAQKARDAEKELKILQDQIREKKSALEYAAKELKAKQDSITKYDMYHLPRALVARMVAETTGDFAPGDEVWRIKEDWSYPKCPRCGGEKKLVAKLANGEDVLVRCPECDGSGTIREVKRSIEKATVSGVYMKLCFDENRCSRWTSDAVFIRGRDNAIDHKKLYREKEEAETALAQLEREEKWETK